ncbi:MAG: cytochrome-c oxidase, cbb3-type subunit III [Parvularculaceae bacterium]|nr:cytochrome-c oxidase, cbb3-type subunit III [Parvularculaceae bacterium]
MAEPEIDEVSGVETTGHSWDGIRELNNPLPRWWLIIFWVCVAWSVVYWVLMPSWPGLTGHFAGTRGHSERKNVAAAVSMLNAERQDRMARLSSIDSIEAIERDPQLLEFTLNAGASLFGDNCATCHGAGGQGIKGFPALVDDDWIWGGSLADIRRTLQVGIRSGHPETRLNVMQAYGELGVLTSSQIGDLADYVLTLSGQPADSAAAARAAPLFEEQCSACHGADGRGNQELGAPNLTDAIWLYGGARADLTRTLRYGRGGVMPAWEERLSEEQIKALAVYVHSLGGGE